MSVRIPMTFTEVEVNGIDSLIQNPAWVLEQKFDGTRGLAVVTSKGVWWPGSGGKGALGHTAAIQHFPKINPVLMSLLNGASGEIVMDGEIMCGSGEFMVWDVAYAQVAGAELLIPQAPLATRRNVLEGMEPGFAGTPVKIVRQARSVAEKQGMLEAVRTGGGEGIMAKQLSGSYQSGQRVKSVLKLKFVKTGDVVVTKVHRPDAKHGSFGLGAYDSLGNLITVGGCSAIGKDPATQVGDVIEVAYLYWTGAALYQPRMLHIRSDKKPRDCLVSQFPAYSREAM